MVNAEGLSLNFQYLKSEAMADEKKRSRAEESAAGDAAPKKKGRGRPRLSDEEKAKRLKEKALKKAGGGAAAAPARRAPAAGSGGIVLGEFTGGGHGGGADDYVEQILEEKLVAGVLQGDADLDGEPMWVSAIFDESSSRLKVAIEHPDFDIDDQHRGRSGEFQFSPLGWAVERNWFNGVWILLNRFGSDQLDDVIRVASISMGVEDYARSARASAYEAIQDYNRRAIKENLT